MEFATAVVYAWTVGSLFGLACGLLCMFVLRLLAARRAIQRTRTAVYLQNFSRLASADTKRLFPRVLHPSWVYFPSREKVDWINSEVVKVWPFVEQAAAVHLASWMESTLGKYKMDKSVSFKCQTFMLGPVPPQIYEMEKLNERSDEITLEFDFHWTGSPTILLMVKLALGLAFPVQVTDVRIHGRMRITFKPLFDEFPCFKAFMYSVKDLRDFRFHLKGESEVAYPVPGVFKIVERSFRAAMLDTLVWPMRKIVEIIPGPYRELEVKVSGVLRAKIVEARNLLNKDLVGKSDPYAMLYIRPIPSRMKRSKTVNNNLSPVWNETFNFEVEDLATQSLFIRVLDDDGVQEADLLGCARFELKNLKPGQLRDLWIPLSKDYQFSPKSSFKYRGEIHLELCYIRSTEDLLTPLASFTAPRSPVSRQLTSMERLFSTNRTTSPAISNLMNPSNMLQTCVVRGLLSVTVVRADSLMNQNPTKELNPYVILKMTKSEALMRTRVVNKSHKPEWNTLFHIMVQDALHDMLVLEVWNHRTFKEKLIGKCAMTLTSLLQNSGSDIEVKLQDETAGRVLLHLDWKEVPSPNLQNF